MECLIQYLDDIEDAFYAIALIGERLRRMVRAVLSIASLVLLLGAGLVLALRSPPLAVGILSLLAVGLLYHSTVSPAPVTSRS
jgi:hypothetical protein